MRQFVLLAHEVPLEPEEISLADLPGTGGRLDAIARSVGAALLTSHGIRETVTVHVVVGDELTIRLEGASLRHLHPDERSTAALLRDAIEAAEDIIGASPAQPHPGVSVRRQDLESLCSDLEGPLVQLEETGRPVVEDGLPDGGVVVLSDHRSYSDSDDETLAAAGAERVRLGPTALHTAHAITVCHHYLDTDGYERF